MSRLERTGSTDGFLKPKTALRDTPLLLVLLLIHSQYLSGLDHCEEKAAAQIRLESQHPWRPPFGLERVGQPLGIRKKRDLTDVQSSISLMNVVHARLIVLLWQNLWKLMSRRELFRLSGLSFVDMSCEACLGGNP
jgi:hypothetical protein